MRHALVVATLLGAGASAACGTATGPSDQQGPSATASPIAPSPAPASASASAEASASSETVTVQATCSAACVEVTFELTVVAAPPAGESLSLDVLIPGQQQHVFVLCGATASRRCAGDGTVYRLVFANVPAGTSTAYSFEEVSTSTGRPAQVTTFRQGTVDLAGSSTVSANFPTGP